MMSLDSLLKCLSTQQAMFMLVFSVLTLMMEIVACRAVLLREWSPDEQRQHPWGLVLETMENQMLKPQRTPSQSVAVLCLATQSCLTLCEPMDCSPPGSYVHGDSPAKNTGVGSLSLLQQIVPTQGSNPGLPHCRRILYLLSQQGSPPNQKRGAPNPVKLCVCVCVWWSMQQAGSRNIMKSHVSKNNINLVI